MKRPVLKSAAACAAAVISTGLAGSTAMGSPQTSRVNDDAKADLRQLAVAEEILLTDTDSYGGFKQLDKNHEPYEVHRGVTARIVHYQPQHGYCLRATTTTRTYTYDSAAGGLYRGGTCKAIKTGPSGGVRRGPVREG